MKKILFTALVLTVTFGYTQVQDHEGNTYKTTQIGNQTWMAENLRVKTFRNGDKILQAKTKEEWVKAGENKTPAWTYYENKQENEAKYGILYNWYAVNDNRGLAPEGWKVASKKDWHELHLGLGKNYANQLRSEGNQWFDSPNNTNSLKFNANGAGLINGKIGWIALKESSYWWTSTEFTSDKANHATIGYGTRNIGIADQNDARAGASPEKPSSKELGFSVRCIKN